jgi:hypothetical protein
VIISSLFFTGKQDSTAYADSIANVTVDDLGLRDGGGERVKQLQVGQQVSIMATVRNHLESDQQAVILVEIRDGSGITEYLAWQSAKIRGNSNYTFDTSWMVEMGCFGAPVECNSNYQARSFAFTSLGNTQVLGVVTTVEGIEVIDESQNGITAFDISVDGKVYGLEYSLGSGNVETITADSQGGSMMLSFRKVSTDTELTVTLSKELMDAVFLNWVYTLPSGEKAKYTPEFALDTMFVEPISVQEGSNSTTWVIPIAADSEELEIFVSAPI